MELTDAERKVLSYCYRGVTKATAEQKIATFFGMQPVEVRGVIDKLKRNGLLVESKAVSSDISAYQASPIKVRSSMIDMRVVEQLKAMESAGKASGFKRRTFDPDTGAISTGEKPAKKETDLGFDIE